MVNPYLEVKALTSGVEPVKELLRPLPAPRRNGVQADVWSLRSTRTQGTEGCRKAGCYL